jgi:hypothetical protein
MLFASAAGSLSRARTCDGHESGVITELLAGKGETLPFDEANPATCCASEDKCHVFVSSGGAMASVINQIQMPGGVAQVTQQLIEAWREDPTRSCSRKSPSAP